MGAVVAIDGPDTAGKTTLADRLADRLDGAVRLSVDDFLTPPAVRYARGRLSPEGVRAAATVVVDNTDPEAPVVLRWG